MWNAMITENNRGLNIIIKLVCYFLKVIMKLQQNY